MGIAKDLVIHLFVAQGIHDVLCIAGCSVQLCLSLLQFLRLHKGLRKYSSEFLNNKLQPPGRLS